MTTRELQNSIIEKVLNSSDERLLEYLYEILEEGNNSEIYQLSDVEKAIVSESKADYISGNIIPNEEVMLRNREWLDE